MKKLEIVIQPEKLEDLKGILDDCQANGLMITNIMGYGNQKGHKKIYRGAEYSVNLLPKVKVETIVEPDTAEKIIKRVVDEIQTGTYGDGKSLYTKYRMQFESEQENVDRMHYNSVQTMKIKKDIDCYQRG